MSSFADALRLPRDARRLLPEAMKLGKYFALKRGTDIAEAAVFINPMLACGLLPGRVLEMVDQVPGDWPLDHRCIYYDFRLERWVRHIEPQSLEECLEEHFLNAPSVREARDRVTEILGKLLRRFG